MRATTDLQLLNIAEEVGVSAWVVKKVLRRYDDADHQEKEDYEQYQRIHKDHVLSAVIKKMAE